MKVVLIHGQNHQGSSGHGQPTIGFKTKFLFGIMRKMQAAGWGSSPEEKEYWQQKGWLGSARPWKAINKSEY